MQCSGQHSNTHAHRQRCHANWQSRRAHLHHFAQQHGNQQGDACRHCQPGRDDEMLHLWGSKELKAQHNVPGGWQEGRLAMSGDRGWWELQAGAGWGYCRQA